MNGLILSRLIEAGYDTYLPLHHLDHIVIRINNELKTVHVQNICSDRNFSPIFKISDRSKAYDFTALADPQTKTVWLVPKEYYIDLTTLRLGEKYEHLIIPEPLSLTHQEQRFKRNNSPSTSELSEKAKQIAQKMFNTIETKPLNNPLS